MNKTRIILLILHFFVTLNAIGGGFYGISGAEGVPVEWLQNTPFNSYFIPSLILALVVGGSSALAGFFVATAKSQARSMSGVAGIILLVWILVQVALIGYVSWLQPAMLLTSVITIFLSTKLNSNEKI